MYTKKNRLADELRVQELEARVEQKKRELLERLRHGGLSEVVKQAILVKIRARKEECLREQEDVKEEARENGSNHAD